MTARERLSAYAWMGAIIGLGVFLVVCWWTP